MVHYLEYIRKASVLVEALPYIQQFQNEIFVVKFGGSALEDPDIFESALRDIVFLETVGAHPVVIHGGGKDITAKLRQMGIETKFIDGLRYTCQDTIEVVDDVLHNTVNPRVVDTMYKFGSKATPLSGKDVISAKKIQTDSDLGFVGEVTDVDVSPILEMIEQHQVPVITPLGYGENGETFNINADISACKIAEGLKARKLVFMSDVPGILRDREDESSLVPTIYINEINDYIQNGIIAGGMVPKVNSALEALESGCKKVHLIDARLQHSILLEIFTDSGVGTEIVAK
ncbi:MAG: acetylglutamate kinase [Lentisphaeria bacterium]|nr:acetylglutamate kinase [Lentisphaeria bacterium]